MIVLCIPLMYIGVVLPQMAKTNDLKQLNAMLLTKMYEQKCESDEQPDHEVLPSVQELTQLQDLCGDSGYAVDYVLHVPLLLFYTLTVLYAYLVDVIDME